MLPFLMAGFLILLIASPFIRELFDPTLDTLLSLCWTFYARGPVFAYLCGPYCSIRGCIARRRQYDYIIIHGAGS